MLKKLMLNRWHRVIALTACLLVFPDTILAVSEYPNLQLNGFIMQSYIKTNKNNFFGTSTGKGSLDYTEIGVNGSVKLSSKLQLASQLLSRRAGETDSGDIDLDFALVDYRIVDKSDFGIGLRAGRVKNPIGFYNETRDVSFTRESIILPQSIYFERTRDVSISSDGVRVYGHKQTSFGVFSGQGGLVLPRVTGVNTEYSLLGGVKPGEFVAKPSYGAQLRLESNDSRLTGAFSYVDLRMEYDPAAAEDSFSENAEVHFNMYIFSLKYNQMKWSFTGEYARRYIRFTGFPSAFNPANPVEAFIPDILSDVTGESFYLQAIYRVNQKWNFISRYDVLYSDKDDRDGALYAQDLAAFGVKSYSRYAKDMMLGVQFNINRYWMSRLELHIVDGTAWLPKQDNPDDSMVEQNWRMLNASVSYRF